MHLGKLPVVWIAPGEVRDERELPRTRMALSQMRAALKNRIQATLTKYALLNLALAAPTAHRCFR
ncbi:MAG TPA: hypothetical protein VIK33_01640 [Anaerolineae bacterium]